MVNLSKSIWDLEKRRLQSVIRDAHDSSVISLHFFANEPVLMSTSADNSIKVKRKHYMLFPIFVVLYIYLPKVTVCQGKLLC